MLYIAEKPELARAIVEALGGGAKHNGYYECGDDRVTWCFGHMLQLYDPEDYDPMFKKWTLESLPMFFVPWKKKPVAKSKDQFAIIVKLLREADVVCHAGDPDAEGQLLVDELLEYVGYTGPVKRVLINDNNTAVVKKALANLRDNAEFKGLSIAAEARQIGDNLYGFNMTRLYTLAARREGYNGVLSVGRVQTPILGMVVRRDRENEGHEKISYYTVNGVFGSGESQVTASYQVKPSDAQDEKGRLSQLAEAQAIADSIGGKTAVVKSRDIKSGETPPPLPYNLLKLQSDAARLYGISPDDVKTITQHLREKFRLITYNRSDSQYLSNEQHEDGAYVLATAIGMIPDFEGHKVKLEPTRKSRAFNSAKVTAHHAIIPTRNIIQPDRLSEDECRIYSLIARAYMAQFMPNHTWERATTIFEVEGHTFTHTATVTLENGWRDLYMNDPVSENPDDPDQTVDGPVFTIGDSVDCIAGECRRRETSPKPLYTISSLLEDLTRVAQYITDDKLRKTLVDKDKDKPGERGGIGTPATRDVIIKTLFDRNFIEYRTVGKKQYVVSTQADRDLYDCLPDTAKFPDMTALWHDQQLEIEKGNHTIGSFVDDLLLYMGVEIARVLENGLSLNIQKHPCPECGSAMTLKKANGKQFWGCSKFPECKTTMPDDNGKPGSRSGLKASDGKTRKFVPRPSVSEKHKCTACGKGLVRRTARKDSSFFWGCSGYPRCTQAYSDFNGKPNYATNNKKEKEAV